jgi:hypothetical protein
LLALRSVWMYTQVALRRFLMVLALGLVVFMLLVLVVPFGRYILPLFLYMQWVHACATHCALRYALRVACA